MAVNIADMMKGLGTGICVLDQDMRIRYANSWYEQVFGDDIGKYYYEICGHKPDIHNMIIESFEQNKSTTVVQTVCDKDGRTFDAALSIIPVVDSSGKRFAGVEVVKDAASYTDINNKIRHILSEKDIDAPFGIFIRDEKGEIISVDQLHIETDPGLPHEADLIRSPPVLFGRFEEYKACPVDLSGLRETTDDLAQSNIELTNLVRSRDDVLNTVAHELRNPITAIHVYAELLHDERLGDISEKQRNALLKILKNSDRITYLINDMLDISKIRSGKIILNPEEVDVTGMINEVMDNMRSLADEKNIHLESDLCDLPPVEIDRNLIGRVVINLLDNAIKFTSEGGHIMVATRDAGDVIEITVSDNGIGIPADKLATIFEEFEQARYHKGTGLGLAIAKRIVEMHHGLIEVESVEGAGCTFTIILPKGDVFEDKNRN